MADELKTKEQIEAAIKELSSGSLALEEGKKLAEKIEKALSEGKFKDAIGKPLKEALSAAKKQVEEAAKSFQDSFSNFDFTSFEKGLKGYVDNWDQIKESGKEFLMTAGRLAMLPQSEFFTTLKGSSALMGDLTESTKIFNDSIGKYLPDSVRAGITEFAAAEQKVNALSQGLFAAAAASGNLSEYASEIGGSFEFEKIEPKLAELNRMTLEIADANNINVSKVRDFAGTLIKNIPNALDQVSNVTTKSGDQFNSLDAAMKVAMGTGQEMSTVIDSMSSGYLKFNLTTRESLENFSSISAASDSLNLPFTMVKGYVDSTAESFMYFKDNTQALVNVMGRLGPAFQAAKLSPAAIAELTGTMVKNIQQMGLAQRSFLSMQTGGPGGLRGGYEIELLKAQGKFDEIQKKTEQALRKQFGGRVVTLQEASRDEGAARQLAKQVQLVTSGPTKVVDTEAQAYKLFEAMRTGITGGKAETGADALQKSVDTGTKFAESQASSLTTIANLSESISMNTAIMAKKSGTEASGFITGIATSAMNKLSEKAEKGGVNIPRGDEIFKKEGRTSSALSDKAATRTLYTEKSPFATEQLSLKDERYLGKPLFDKPIALKEAAESEEGAAAYARQQASFDLPPESLSIPLQGRKGLAPSEEVQGILDSYNQGNAPQKRANAPEGERNQHTVTIVLQNPDGRELQQTVLNIINGESSLDRQASTIGARTQQNPR